MSVDDDPNTVYRWEVQGESCIECEVMAGVVGTMNWWMMHRRPGFHPHCDCLLVLDTKVYPPDNGGWDGRSDALIAANKKKMKDMKRQPVRDGVNHAKGGSTDANIPKPDPRPWGDARTGKRPTVGVI